MVLIWVMQLAKWPRSRVRTSVLTPSQVERNRVTSFMHSLKPARYLPRTVGSVLRAAVGGERHTAVSRLHREERCTAYQHCILQPPLS